MGTESCTSAKQTIRSDWRRICLSSGLHSNRRKSLNRRMKTNRRQQIDESEHPSGKDCSQTAGIWPFVSIPHPIIIEMIGHANYDFVIIDLEHTATSMESVEELIRAAELVGLTPLVRISQGRAHGDSGRCWTAGHRAS